MLSFSLNAQLKELITVLLLSYLFKQYVDNALCTVLVAPSCIHVSAGQSAIDSVVLLPPLASEDGAERIWLRCLEAGGQLAAR